MKTQPLPPPATRFLRTKRSDSARALPKVALHASSDVTCEATTTVADVVQPPKAALRYLYTVAEVVTATGFADSTIRRAIRLKHLVATKVGRGIRLTEADVEAWLDGNERKPR